MVRPTAASVDEANERDNLLALLDALAIDRPAPPASESLHQLLQRLVAGLQTRGAAYVPTETFEWTMATLERLLLTDRYAGRCALPAPTSLRSRVGPACLDTRTTPSTKAEVGRCFAGLAAARTDRPLALIKWLLDLLREPWPVPVLTILVTIAAQVRSEARVRCPPARSPLLTNASCLCPSILPQILDRQSQALLAPLAPVLAADVLTLLESPDALQLLNPVCTVLVRLAVHYPSIYASQLFVVRLHALRKK